MISIVLKQPTSVLLKYRMTAKDMQKMCQSSRLVTRVLKILNESVKQQNQAQFRRRNTEPSQSILKHQARSIITGSKDISGP